MALSELISAVRLVCPIRGNIQIVTALCSAARTDLDDKRLAIFSPRSENRRGPELVDKQRRKREGFAVVFVSGCTDASALENAKIGGGNPAKQAVPYGIVS